MSTFSHVSVMLPEVLALAQQVRPQRIIDGTLGGGGHAAALLQACPEAQLLGIDRDPAALAAAALVLAPFGDRAKLVRGTFSQAEALAVQAGWGDSLGIADVVLVDLGVSSHQLDTAGRGFSFRADGPLDMRMDPDAEMTALSLLEDIEADDLAHILRTLGEERYSGRVARAIVRAKPQTTQALAEVVRAHLPPQHGPGIDPATRTFQALRMAVNDELGQIDKLMATMPKLLRDNGMLLGISFHSLEDRRLKQGIYQLAHPCTCPPKLVMCICNKQPQLQATTPPLLRPSAEEVAHNPRSRSARLRAARRLLRAA